MKKVLVFTRPFTNNFCKLYSNYNSNVMYISDFKGYVECDPMKHIYNNWISISEDEYNKDLDYCEIIMRDRYLRYLELNISKKLINGIWDYLNTIFKENEFESYIGLPVDNYVQHLIVLKCYLNNIKCISPAQSPIPLKMRITNLGEYIKCRDVADVEVDYIYKVLSEKKFRPIWLNNKRTKKNIFWLYIKERIKKIIFVYKKISTNDPYSFHYNCIYPMKGSITIHSLNVLNVNKLFFSNYDEIIDATKKYKKIVYFPLQFNPEQTINYLIKDYKFGQYDLLIEKIIDSLSEDTLLIVKEHPDIYGYRGTDFYKKFLNKRNVLLVDVGISTNEILEVSDFLIVTGSASTGMEAIIKDKTVIALGGAFYSFGGKYCHQVNNFDDVSKVNDLFSSIVLSKEEKYEFIRKVLENTLDLNYEHFVRAKKNDYNININTTKEILDFMEKYTCAE